MAQNHVPKNRLELLVRGLPGHPLHPPLTDATIGSFAFAAAAAVVGYADLIADKTGPAAWLGLIAGLAVAIPTAATGFVDWLYLAWGSPRWRTATWHLTAMLSAVTLFAIAAWRQYPGYQHGDVTLAGLIFSVAGFIVLTIGGWLGGSVVFVHGARVLRAETEVGEEPGGAMRRTDAGDGPRESPSPSAGRGGGEFEG